jgi:hypothetical protein
MPAPPNGLPHHYLPRARRAEADYTIAEACAEAWYRERGGAHPRIAIGAVTALALWPLKGPDAWMQGDWWLSLDQEQLTAALRECWARWWVQRPDLIHRAAPLYDWLNDDLLRGAAMPAVQAVIRTAITEGVLDLVSSGDAYQRTDTDVLGWMVTLMRSGGEKRALAEFPTPPEMAVAMARLLLPEGADSIRPGQAFHDPTSGTGAMIRAVALHLRDRGLDPADFAWAMTDLDSVSVAVAACCAILWDLGPNVLAWCGDTLHEGDGPERGAAEKARLIAARDRTCRQVAALSGSLALIGPARAGTHRSELGETVSTLTKETRP